MKRAFILVVAVAICCAILDAQPKRRVATTARESSLAPMRQQTIRGYTYLYATTQTSIMQIGQIAEPTINKLSAAMKANSIAPRGPMIFTYHGVTGDPHAKFT